MHRPMFGMRKADKAHGDDTTLTRFVREDQSEGGRHRRVNQARLPGMEAPFIQAGRTKFAKAVQRPSDLPHLLVSGHNNVKIGRDVRKGHLRGYWIYTLSLEERKTCPSSCQHWQSCYGNNMPFAKRIDHTDPAFLPMLEKEIAELCAKREGILVRLHALGDFYSPEYVRFWATQLHKHSNLALYGYTAHWPSDPIGYLVRYMNVNFGKRSMVRFSNLRGATMSTVSIGSEESCPPNAFICPEQTGKTRACATCGACWSTVKNVAFLEH